MNKVLNKEALGLLCFKSLENTGNILRQIEEAQQYLKLCEASQVQVRIK